jgi:uncharacterized protein
MNRFKEIGILIAGWIFLVLGILGLFLPILQGVLFILIGLAILSSRSKMIQRLLKGLEERFPQHHAKVEKWKERVTNWFKIG